MLTIFPFPDTLPPLFWQYALPVLPPRRQAQLLRYRQDGDRQRCAAAYLALLHALSCDAGIDTVTGWAVAPSGKPYLPDHPSVHFSLSHCREAVVCAVDRCAVGVDVQSPQSLRSTVAALDHYDFVFSPAERARIAADPCPAAQACRLWVIKESIGKLTGEGITGDLCRLTSSPGVTTGLLRLHSPDLFIAVSSFAQHAAAEPAHRFISVHELTAAREHARQICGADRTTGY